MKRLMMILAVGVVVLAGSSFAGSYGGGTGTEGDPYQIWTAEQMNAIGADPNDWDKHFVLMDDIDLNDYDGQEGRPAFNNIGKYSVANDPENVPFSGTFNAFGHEISNFTYISTDINKVGLFGYVGIDAVIRNLGLVDCYIEVDTGNGAGTLVGVNEGAITNCYVEGGSFISSVNNCGGLVSRNIGGNIIGCHANLNVTGGDQVGGLAGANIQDGVISNSYATGSVVGNLAIGGLVGRGNEGNIINCYAEGVVEGSSNVGGLLGKDFPGSTITNCSASGSVLGLNCVGGLIGSTWHGLVQNCYATGDVVGSETVGGLIGVNSESKVICCFSIGNIRGETSHIGGLCGQNRGTITNCYANGTVTGEDGYDSRYLGGLCGENYNDCTITNCYATGSVRGSNFLGGLCGVHAKDGTIVNCYATGTVTGNNYLGGLFGYNTGENVIGCFWDVESSGIITSNGGTGLPTEEMQKMITFTNANWDFINTWNIGENQTYPYLRTFPASDINKDRVVNLIDLSILAGQWLEEE